MLIENIRLFLIIAEKGSLIAAARETRLSATTVSERLAALEAHYGVVLFNRTTRSISLTDEGRTLLNGARIVLGEIEDLETRIRFGAETLSGPIRVSAPIDLGRNVVSEVISDFTRQHPAISIELFLSDGYVDMVGHGFDLALRYGEITDSTLRTRNLGQFHRIVCAAPSYLQLHGTPQEPADLAGHNCLIMRLGTTLDNVWHFGPDKAPQSVTVRGNKTVNDGSMVRQWALEGQGIIMKSELDVAQDIKAGRLVALLQDYTAAPKPLQMMFPPARAQPRRVRALADALGTAVGQVKSPLPVQEFSHGPEA
ncbi:LysR family transcriptional regulator [Paracoccus seriniphilus]|uniref:Transcriptional regulator, LysR family n=1 Tax=Paracoccus seriniphilus TaxID=184748 RepID=A0A239PU41_9RHOB|nr:LysR family transcriptional regulator [Paracoccus seriniphilus]WCR16382.1 LysR family transcriptional regulator [Paracoccus seriniphilus]SNT73432.1 transcriptional regulator, LysR family [Paracoccus seriniphilus]